MADAGTVVWNLDAESKGFDSKIKKASKDAKDFGKELDGIDLSGVLNKAGDVLGKVGSAIFDVGKKATIAFGAATVAATAFSVKSAADFEQTRIGLENMLGSADGARSLLKDISKFAAETPFEFPELAQATRQLVAFGFTGKEAFDTMKQLGNVSAAVGAPINDLAYLMGTLRAQGRAFTIDIRQFAQRGIPIYEYLGKVLHKNTEQITAMIEAGQIGFPEVQKAFQLLAGEGGKWGNTMARQSKSLSGLFSTLKDTLGQTGRELIGITQEGDIKEGSVFARLRDAVDGLTQNLPRLIDQMKSLVSGIIPQLAQWAKNVKDVAVQIGDYLAPKFEALWHSIKDAIPTFEKFWKNIILPLATAFGASLVVALGLTVDTLNALFKIIKPVLNFMADNKEVVLGLVGAFVALKTAMLLRDAFDALHVGFEVFRNVSIPNTIATLGTWKDTFLNTMSAAKDGIKSLVTKMGDVLEATGKWILESAKVALEWGKNLAKMVASSAVSAVKMIPHAIDVGAAWVINAVRASFAWVTQELPKIIVSMAKTAFWATIHAAEASAAWIINAVKTSVAWTITELPKIVAGFVVTTAAAVLQASLTAGAWVLAASKTAIVWVVTTLPQIIATFVAMSGSAIVNAAIATGAWVASATTTSQTFLALKALIATPLVMPAIIIVAALASLYEVLKAVQAIKDAINDVNNAAKAAQNLAPEQQMRDLQAKATAARARGDTAEVARISKALSALGGNASGTDYWKGGPTWVGEKGPEIVNLPRGSEVIPNHKIGSQGLNSEYNIGTINISSEADGERWLKKLTRNQEIFDNGLTPSRNAI